MQTRWFSFPLIALSALPACAGPAPAAPPAKSAAQPAPAALPPEPVAMSKLKLQVLTASPDGFFVNSTLISGEKEAVLIDAQFTLADAKALAAGISASGKRLTMVYVTHAHPDHYFGFNAIQEVFPDVALVALQATVSEIERTWEDKVKAWKPLYKETIADKPVIPDALVGTSIDLEGETLELVGGRQGDAANNSYVWIPTLGAIVSGDVVYDAVFPWTAETTPESRKAWSDTLDEIAARNPKVVVPGHQKPEQKQEPSNLQFTKDYLTAYDTALSSVKTSEELIAKIKAQYPDTALDVILKLGAEASLPPPKAAAKPSSKK